jgi:hypothetical protein
MFSPLGNDLATRHSTVNPWLDPWARAVPLATLSALLLSADNM